MAVKTTYPLVSIVILNWNGLEDTKICLDYVNKINYPNYEIVLVDNGSSQDQKNYLSKLENVVYVDNPKNRGFAGGQSDGYNHAKGDFILLLNNDAVIQADYLTEAMPLFDDPKVAVVGGRSYFWNEDEPLLDKTNRFYSYMTIDPISAETTLNMSDYGTTQEVNVVSGSAVIVRREVINKVGYLWEQFFAYYEETDLFARIKRAGYKVIYNPKLQIWHKNGASSGAQSGSFFFFFHIFRNRYMFAQRNFDDEYLSLFKKSYYKLALKAVSEIPASKSQRTLAKAYLKAISYVNRNEKMLKISREELKEQFKNSSYSRQIIKEQISLSIVIDATQLTREKVKDMEQRFLIDLNPLHEYVIVTKHTDISSANLNIRFVNNKGYFNTHPVNIGCIVARHKWMLVCDSSSDLQSDKYLDILVDKYLENPSVIDISTSAILMTKEFYEIIGGFQESKTNLNKSIKRALEYAQVDQVLSSNRNLNISSSLRDKLLAEIKSGKSINSVNQLSLWGKILSKYYRLYQFNNLIQWSFQSNIPIRLKAGRTKNLITSGVTLNKSALAIELKHIHNELLIATRNENNPNTQQKIQETSEQICKDTKKDVKNIPIFIICFERVKDLRKLVEWLESIGMRKIVFIDNDSTYPPLLDFYNTTRYQVLKLGRNVGHTAPWSLGIIRSLVPDGMYIVTDPDVIPDDKTPKDAIEHFLDLHIKYPGHKKVGFSLKIDDIPNSYPLKNEVIEWEQQFWNNILEPGVYEAGVDTTFALYKPHTYTYTLHPSIRVGGVYTARHTPWYENHKKKSDEEVYYRLRANSNVTSWNVDELPERYKKEMNNVKK
jgi:GT2 family glycosyltransferase